MCFFSRIDCLIEKYKLESNGYNVSIIYGGLPPEVKKKQMDNFINGKSDIAVSTDAIAMGLNLPCDYVIFRADTKFDGICRRKLTTTEVKQIGGRAGRYKLSEKGIVGGHTKKINEFIKRNINCKAKSIDKAYYGIDLNILKSLKGNNIKKKILEYKKIDIIPDGLKKKVFIEDITKYINVIDRNKNINNLSIGDAWNIVNIPFDEKYILLNSMINSIQNNSPLIYHTHNIKISDVVSLKEAENTIKVVESLLHFSYKYPDLVSDETKEKVGEFKNGLINKITSFLMDKKLSSIKKCIDCGINIGIKNRHAKCNECHYGSFDDEFFYWE